ncbi:hypothetical protein EYF80_020585 [Liparis tanakae]|uniref:Uncharacterized protein n=1 Tax=Liparis tanakae TaxID=230148 RepID=A0A4Z2HU47_9TELE|nr:hypothetical protein EYF80_020585 [Liparis tanakae]
MDYTWSFFGGNKLWNGGTTLSAKTLRKMTTLYGTQPRKNAATMQKTNFTARSFVCDLVRLNVAESHHCKRDQEENVLLEDTDAFPLEGFVLAAQGVFTVVRDPDEGAVEQGGNGGSNADYPQEERHIHPRAESQAGQWVDHYQIPVDGHDGQEEDAAVKPDEEDKSHYFAKGL